jgi:hypothetical protein
VEKNEILPETSKRMYGLEIGRTVQSVTMNFIFTNHPIVSVSLC